MLTLALALALHAAPETITLAPGAQQVIRAPGLKRVAIGDNAIADVTPTASGEVLVVGKQLGRTAITLWTKSGVRTQTVVVDDGKGDELQRALRETIGPGLVVHKLSGRMVVDGTVDSMEEMKRLRALVGNDPNVVVLVQLNPRLLPVIAETITSSLHRAGLTHAHATVLGTKIVLEGSVADATEMKKAMLIAQAYAEPLSSLSQSR